MEWFRLIGFCILAAVMVVAFRQISPVWAGLICSVFGVMMLSFILPQMHGYIESIQGLLQTVGLEGKYYQLMLKTMGIVLVTQTAAQVCRDMDAPAVACRVEMCGRIALLGIAVPVFIELTQMAVGILGASG